MHDIKKEEEKYKIWQAIQSCSPRRKQSYEGVRQETRLEIPFPQQASDTQGPAEAHIKGAAALLITLPPSVFLYVSVSFTPSPRSLFPFIHRTLNTSSPHPHTRKPHKNVRYVLKKPQALRTTETGDLHKAEFWANPEAHMRIHKLVFLSGNGLRATCTRPTVYSRS
ncbi:hypothetical protein NQZ68_032057 [Dissostichus eleginoides]|nr:hypothetical protein NQZ68_032057 [Dissostichus eleginoides]